MEPLIVVFALAWLASPLVLFALIRRERSQRRDSEAERTLHLGLLGDRVRDLERRLDEAEALLARSAPIGAGGATAAAPEVEAAREVRSPEPPAAAPLATEQTRPLQFGRSIRRGCRVFPCQLRDSGQARIAGQGVRVRVSEQHQPGVDCCRRQPFQKDYAGRTVALKDAVRHEPCRCAFGLHLLRRFAKG